mmetsp:Transcript_19098/g.51344  ORF Transcript_19098/g.51344 Transcript_19098/m.51344 type:complete len:1232 (-) Transcript_19098:320-4015(-)
MVWVYDKLFPVSVGEHVDAESSGQWLPGTVTDVIYDEERGPIFTVDYDDYDPEEGIDLKRIRRRGVINDSFSFGLALTIGYPVGAKVIANRYGNNMWQPGDIVKVHRDGTYDIEYEEGQVEEHVGPLRIRLNPSLLDILGSVKELYSSTFTVEGRMARMGVVVETVMENHEVPTRFDKGDKVLIEGREGVFTVTGFAGSSDATVTLIGLRRDRVDDESSAAELIAEREMAASVVDSEGQPVKKMSKKKKKGLDSLKNDDRKPMQLYYPQASWRLHKVNEFAVGQAVACYKNGNDDADREHGVIVSKQVHFDELVDDSGGLLGFIRRTCLPVFRESTAVFNPSRSIYRVRYADGMEYDELAMHAIDADDAGAPLPEGQVRFALGEQVTYAVEDQDHWLEIVGVTHKSEIYNVRFEDGDREFNLTREAVRRRDKNPIFQLGEEVECNKRHSGKLQMGVIHYVNPADEFGVITYDVRYKTGETEEEVDANNIFKVEVEGVKLRKIKRGTLVYARRRSNGQWYAGTIIRVETAAMYQCQYMYDHTDPDTGRRVSKGDRVDVLEDDLDSPLRPMRYTVKERDIYRKINAAMWGREVNEAFEDRPPKLLTNDQKDFLREVVEAHTEDIWNALDPQIFDLDRCFLHTIRDAQTEKRRANYIEVSNIVFEATDNEVPIDAFDANGLTPLYLAVTYSDEDIVWHLIEHGADPLMPSIGLRAPAHIILDPTFSITNSILAAQLTGLESVPGRREFKSIGGRKRLTTYNFALLNPSFYDLEPNATPNCFTDTSDFQDPRRHVGNGISPLRMIVDEGLTEMMYVPVVRKVLDEMWNRFTLRFQLQDAFAAYVTIALFLLITTRLFGNADPQVGARDTWNGYDWSMIVIMCLVILIVLMGVRDELFEIRRLGLTRYFSSSWNVVEMISYTLLIISLGLDGALLFDKLPTSYKVCDRPSIECVHGDFAPLKRRITAFAAILVWIRGLKYVTMFQSVGILVRMVGRMLGEVAVFLVVFFFLMFGWANAFTIIMADRPDESIFDDFGDSLIVCFRLALADFEWDDFSDYPEEHAALIALWFSFLCVSAVLMLNLLIAQLSNVYTIITANVEAEYLLSKASIIFNTQDQLLNAEPKGPAGRDRIEKLNYNMTFVPPQEVEFNRYERERIRKDEQENYADHIKDKLREIEIELKKQSAFIEASSSSRAARKASARVEEMMGAGDDDERGNSSKGGFFSSLSRSSSPRRS